MKTTLLFIFTLFCSTTFGQFHSINKETLSEIENKGVIFELLPESENDLSYIPKKKKKEKDPLEFPEFNKKLNESAKRTFAKYWKLTKGEVKFKTQKEISELSLDVLKDNVLVSASWITKDTQYQGFLTFFAFNIKHVNAKVNYEDIFEFAFLPNSDIVDADFIFFLKTLDNTKVISLNYDAYKKSHIYSENMNRIETKTLLVDSSMLNPKTTIEQITAAYPYKYLIVNDDVIEKAINEECDSCLFFKLIWARGMGMGIFDVFDTKDMKILAAIGTGGVTIKFGGTPHMSSQFTRGWDAKSNSFGYTMHQTALPPSYLDGKPAAPGTAGKGGKVLWQTPLKIADKHFKVIYNEGAQKMNFK
jgi:hypothetical protein